MRFSRILDARAEGSISRQRPSASKSKSLLLDRACPPTTEPTLLPSRIIATELKNLVPSSSCHCKSQDPITEATKAAILEAFFDAPENNSQDETHKSHCDYYKRELKRLRIGITHSSRIIDSLAAKTHNDIPQICLLLKDSERTQIPSPFHRSPQPKLASKFPAGSTTNTTLLSIDRSLDLTARLWLMVNVLDDEYWPSEHHTSHRLNVETTTRLRKS